MPRPRQFGNAFWPARSSKARAARQLKQRPVVHRANGACPTNIAAGTHPEDLDQRGHGAQARRRVADRAIAAAPTSPTFRPARATEVGFSKSSRPGGVCEKRALPSAALQPLCWPQKRRPPPASQPPIQAHRARPPARAPCGRRMPRSGEPSTKTAGLAPFWADFGPDEAQNGLFLANWKLATAPHGLALRALSSPIETESSAAPGSQVAAPGVHLCQPHLSS